MKKLRILFILLIAFGFSNSFIPEPKEITAKFFPEVTLEINTPAFQKKNGYTTYKELIGFLNHLESKHGDVMSIRYIGESQKGKAIPLVTLNNKSTEPKVKVWLQGGLHGDEMASTEGVLYMLDKLLNDEKYSYLLQRLEIGIVPMANIDGYEKQDRYAANGLDLNRDQTKLMIKESISLKQAFSDFEAEVAVDFHEYRPYRRDYTQMSTLGITSRFDAMFMYSGNLNVPKIVREYTHSKFVRNAETVLGNNNIAYRDYVSTHKVYGDIHFNQGSNNARSSATSYALANTISSLIEIRGVGIGRTSFKRRINSTFLIGMSYMKTAYDNVQEVKTVLAEGAKIKTKAVVTSKKNVSKQPLIVIDIETCKELELDVTIHNASKSRATLSRKRATAYILTKDQVALVKKLEVLGLKISQLTTEKIIEVETYTVIEYYRHLEKYEGTNVQEVKTAVKTENITIPVGSYVLNMNQDNSNLAIEVLEPEAPNSFVYFGVLKTKKNEKLPIYRYLKSDKI